MYIQHLQKVEIELNFRRRSDFVSSGGRYSASEEQAYIRGRQRLLWSNLCKRISGSLDSEAYIYYTCCRCIVSHSSGHIVYPPFRNAWRTSIWRSRLDSSLVRKVFYWSNVTVIVSIIYSWSTETFISISTLNNRPDIEWSLAKLPNLELLSVDSGIGTCVCLSFDNVIYLLL